jgi:hypothetical protein
MTLIVYVYKTIKHLYDRFGETNLGLMDKLSWPDFSGFLQKFLVFIRSFKKY